MLDGVRKRRIHFWGITIQMDLLIMHFCFLQSDDIVSLSAWLPKIDLVIFIYNTIVFMFLIVPTVSEILLIRNFRISLSSLWKEGKPFISLLIPTNGLVYLKWSMLQANFTCKIRNSNLRQKDFTLILSTGIARWSIVLIIFLWKKVWISRAYIIV